MIGGLLPILIWAVLIFTAPFLFQEFELGLFSTIGLNIILALALILVTGYAGQFSLAGAAFYGLGAYGSGILTASFGWPASLALLVSAGIAALVALLIGRPIFRLKGHFLAMATLALTQIFYLLVTHLALVGGSTGFGGIPSFSLLGFAFDTLAWQFILVWMVVGVTLWGSLKIGKGREGRALKALRGHEAAASAFGINVSWSKTKIFVLSAAIGSMAGSFYAHQMTYINPPPFAFGTAINILAIAVLGGLRTPWGAVVGAALYEGLRQIISEVLPAVFGPGSVGPGQTLILGALLVVILVLRPDGVAGLVTETITKLRKGGRKRAVAERETDDDGMLGAEAYESLVVGPPSEEVVLEAVGLSKHYGGVKAVNNLDLKLHKGEILAVIGPNGAGKTTLLNMLSGNIKPTRGQVLVQGIDLTQQPTHEAARHGIARTFQTATLFGAMTVHENVLVGAHTRGKVGLLRSAVPTRGAINEERRLRAEVDQVLSESGLQDLRDKDADELSLGQQKLVEVARALAQRPNILLLDEPGAGLTRVEKIGLGRRLRELQRDGLSILLIEHDMEFVMGLADRVHVVNFGETLTVGSPAETQTDDRVIAAYLGTVNSEES